MAGNKAAGAWAPIPLKLTVCAAIRTRILLLLFKW